MNRRTREGQARVVGMSERAGRLLDAARETLLPLARAHPDGVIRDQAARAAARLLWAGSWLDLRYEPATARVDDTAPDGERAARELHEAADQFDELVGDLEGDDPVANANGVQTSCLAFAIVGAMAAYLDRVGAARRHQAEK